jgi:hypothetical protein
MSAIILNLIRNGMLVLSGFVANGVLKPYIGTVITSDDWNTIVNSVIALVLVLASAAWKWLERRKHVAATIKKVEAAKAQGI